jgi:hypothetical protein
VVARDGAAQMSPELEAMLADEDTALALKRLYTYQRLRELNAPLPIIEKASSLLDESKKQLGSGYRILIHTVYEEYRQIEDTNIQSQEA